MNNDSYDIEVEDAEYIEILDLDTKKLNLDETLRDYIEDIKNYEQGYNEKDINGLLNDCKNRIIDSVLGPLGVSRDMFDDKDGGSVTTEKNFQEGICSTDEDNMRYKELVADYRPEEYHGNSRSYRSIRHKKMKNWNGTCAYTGKKVSFPDLDHIVPAKEIDKDPGLNLFLSKEERINLANSEENVVLTDPGVNRSKKDNTLTEYAKKQETMSDKQKQELINRDECARTAIKRVKTFAQIKKQGLELGKTSFKTSSKMALKTIFAEVLKITVEEFISVLKQAMKEYTQIAGRKISWLLNRIKELCNNIIKKIQSKFANILKVGAYAFLSGVISNIVTFVINNFLTTFKNMVAIIREGSACIAKAGKTFFFDKYATQEEKYKAVGEIVFAGFMSCIGILVGSAIKTFVVSILTATPIAFASDIISDVVMGMVIGVSIVVGSYWYNKLQVKLKENQLALVYAHQTLFITGYHILATEKILNGAEKEAVCIGMEISEQQEKIIGESDKIHGEVKEQCEGLMKLLNGDGKEDE